MTTYPAGTEIDYNYGSSGDLNYAISRLDHMSESGTTLESYKYMGLGTVVEKDHPQDGVNLTYIGTANGDAGDTVVGLDRFGRVTGQYWVSGTTNASTQLDAYAYTYDADGNVLSKSNLVNSSFSENYTYDGLSRLTAVSRGTSSQAFNLNNIGAMNSVTTNGTVQNHTTNDENQIINIGSSTISYDANGNVTTDDHGNTLVYDAWNRLVEVKASNGTIIAGYTYDGYGRMTSETNVTTTTDFYYTGTQDIEERTGVTDYTGASLSSNGTTTLVNVYSPDYVNDILLRDNYSSGSFSSRIYFSHDLTYSVTGVFSSAGSVLQRQVYDSYGNITFLNASWASTSDAYKSEQLFQGGWRSQFTDYYHFDARWYSPTLQWLSWDPANYPDGMSGYLPMADNPINFDDPSGNFAIGKYDIGGTFQVKPVSTNDIDKYPVKQSIIQERQKNGEGGYEVIYTPDAAHKDAGFAIHVGQAIQSGKAKPGWDVPEGTGDWQDTSTSPPQEFSHERGLPSYAQNPGTKHQDNDHGPGARGLSGMYSYFDSPGPSPAPFPTLFKIEIVAYYEPCKTILGAAYFEYTSAGRSIPADFNMAGWTGAGGPGPYTKAAVKPSPFAEEGIKNW